jgi:hypothetical protein
MSERCKHVEKNGFNCGSYAFNLYKDGIDQGNLCDVHYWQAKALAQPEQEPVAWFSTLPDGRLSIKIVGKPTEGNWEPLYTTPPQRTWIGLTDDEIIDVLHPLVMADMSDEATDYEIARAIEAKLKEKNT